MEAKMNILAVVIIGLVTFIGGMFTEYGIQRGLPPKNQTINNVQIQNVENRNIQSSSQAQITVVTARTNVNINISARTNFSVSSRTNRLSKTNIAKESKNILGIPLP